MLKLKDKDKDKKWGVYVYRQVVIAEEGCMEKGNLTKDLERRCVDTQGMFQAPEVPE